MNQTRIEEEVRSSEKAKTKLFLSIVIPAYNEAENLPRTLTELQENISRSTEVEDYELIVVDDHSSDNTFEWVRSLNDKRIHCVRLSRQSGSHTAIRAGLACSRGDAVLYLSADGQDDPSVLGEMLKKLAGGNHIVWAVRRKREEPLWTKLPALAAYKLIDLLTGSGIIGSRVAGVDFYLLSKKVSDAINHCPERNTSIFGLICWLGFKQDFVTYDRKPRLSGDSKWRFRSRLRFLIDWIVAFSGVPLKLISFLGMLTASLGFLYALFVIGYTLLGYAKPGWAETVTLILVLGGAQMMMLGVVGEYLWRTLDETRKRPLYFIEDRTDQ